MLDPLARAQRPGARTPSYAMMVAAASREHAIAVCEGRPTCCSMAAGCCARTHLHQTRRHRPGSRDWVHRLGALARSPLAAFDAVLHRGIRRSTA
ncbi:MAG: hypothetical protein IPM01_25495 [Burkholderiaceae bacterium]|nr:hypothetical protein [Burkholderiaceae bacterium]